MAPSLSTPFLAAVVTIPNPKGLVLAYARLGNKDQALDWLERAYTERSEAVLYLKVDPRYDSLRADLHFKKLLQQMRLAD